MSKLLNPRSPAKARNAKQKHTRFGERDYEKKGRPTAALAYLKPHVLYFFLKPDAELFEHSLFGKRNELYNILRGSIPRI